MKIYYYIFISALIIISTIAVQYIEKTIAPPNEAVPQARTGALPRVTVGVVRDPSYYLVAFAKKLGYYRYEGIDVVFDDYFAANKSPEQNHREWAQGLQDIAVATNSSFLSYSDNYQNGKIALVNTYRMDASGFLGRPMTPPLEKSQGKTFFIPEGAELQLAWALHLAGVTPEEVTYKVFPLASVYDEYKKSTADYFFAYDAHTYDKEIKEGNLRLVHDSSSEVGGIMVITVFHNNFIREHRDRGLAFLRAYFKAQHYAEEHPKEAAEFGSKWTGLDVEKFKKIIKDDEKILNLSEAEAALDDGHDLLHLPNNLRYLILIISGKDRNLPRDESVLIERSFVDTVKRESDSKNIAPGK